MSTKSSTNDWQNDWQKCWSPQRRAAASVVILLHLLAVIVAPWSAPPPSALLAQQAARVMMPYQVAMFLNHGYRFFAPDPGPSHIIRYEMRMADGSQRSGRLPDPDRHWPRLLYHRHFMMTESVFSLFTQIDDQAPVELMTPAQRAELESRNEYTRQLVKILSQSIAEQLLEEHGGTSVHLYLQQHDIPYPEDVEAGMRIDDARLYVEVTDLGEFSGADS